MKLTSVLEKANALIEAKGSKWIQKAVKNKGALKKDFPKTKFTQKNLKKIMKTGTVAQKKRASLAKTLAKFRKK
jgi:hypothetical protein